MKKKKLCDKKKIVGGRQHTNKEVFVIVKGEGGNKSHLLDMAQFALAKDPSTGLPIISVPPEYSKYFSELKNCVIHWFGNVDKYSQKWQAQSRICIITDEYIYLARTDGGITRCSQIKMIEEIVVIQHKSVIAMRIAPPDYDMLLQARNEEARTEIIAILCKIISRATGRRTEPRMVENVSDQGLHAIVNLKKPDDWVLRVQPFKTTKALTKAVRNQKDNEERDRKLVKDEFDRIKVGLMDELQRYRTQEHEQLREHLELTIKKVAEKDMALDELRRTTVRLDDPDAWKSCPHCVELQKLIERHPSDDKQRIFRLEREVEDQRHQVEHLQTAIKHRQQNSLAGGEGSSQVAVIHSLRHDLEMSTVANKELQKLIIDSPMLTAETKQRAARMSLRNTDHPMMGSQRDQAFVLAERDREIRHLKATLRDATFKHLQELEMCRTQIQRYDDQVVEHVTKLQQELADAKQRNNNNNNPISTLSTDRYPPHTQRGMVRIDSPQAVQTIGDISPLHQQQQPISGSVSPAPSTSSYAMPTTPIHLGVSPMSSVRNGEDRSGGVPIQFNSRQTTRSWQ